MDITLIKNSWDRASSSLNNHWAINEYIETSKNSVFKADGIIYSPVDDVQRPYPIFTLDFTMTYQDSAFEIKIILPKSKRPIVLDNKNKFFEKRGNDYYIKLNNDLEKTKDVTGLLNFIYDWLFPSNKEMPSTVSYWVSEIPNLYPNE